MLIAKTKSGIPIIGTNELVYGVALIHGADRDADGFLSPTYVGETRIDWDSQRTVYTGNQRQYVADNGEIFLEDELVWEEES